MGKILAFVMTAAIGAVTAHNASAPPALAEAPPAAALVVASGPSMPGCLRQMAAITPSADDAARACDCMFGEFASRGIGGARAGASGGLEEMGRITRSCARLHGAVLPI